MMAEAGTSGANRALVLTGIDGGSGTRAVLAAAGRLASLAGAALLVAHIAPDPPAMAPVLLGPPATDHEDLEAELFPCVVEALCHCPVEWSFVIASGHPGHGLARLADQHHVLAIVVGADTPGCAGHIRRLTSGSVPTYLIHHQGAPVVVVPEAVRRPSRAESTLAEGGIA
jgi:nucleotide-binding universal stress UspA family protein